MKLPNRFILVFLLVLVGSASALTYGNYQKGQNEFHLIPVSARLRDSSGTITHTSASHFVIDSGAPAESIWLNLKYGYFNHAGKTGGSSWGWMALPTITANENEFRYELNENEYSYQPLDRDLPRIEIAIKHTQPSPRVSSLAIATVLIDKNGREIDSKTTTITITDTPAATNGG